MYTVRQQERLLASFSNFIDAWLYAYLELEAFSLVTGPDGEWHVNPGWYEVN